MVFPSSMGASGHTTVDPSRRPTLMMPPSAIIPSGPVSSASVNPAARTDRRW
jgi:hypothetical protein